MSVEELNDKLSRWNPMESDYKNTDFNHYISGPGADLDAELQPGQQALQKSTGYEMDQKEKQPVPSLIFKKLPPGMTTNAMRNICSRHGAVREVRDSNKNDYYFVDMATVSDMEAVFRALENNNYGFIVMVSKNQNKRQLGTEINKSQQNFSHVPPNNTGIDYQNRNYRTSKKSHPRPKVEEESFLNATDAANTGLPLDILTNDAHSLERQGLYKMGNNNKFNYHHGRSYVSMPEKTKQFIDKKHKESSGAYNATTDKYEHTLESSQMTNKTAKCSQCFYDCNTICERCIEPVYYCSVECQKSDWPDHRYICGKPKHMQRTPPSKEKIQSDNNSSKTQKKNNNRVVETSNNAEDKVMKQISPEKHIKSTKPIPKQLRCNDNVAFQHLTSSKIVQETTTSVKAIPQQLQNSSNASSEQLPTTSKPSSKKLPAALRASFNQVPNSPEEASQQLPTSSKASSEQLPTTSKPYSKKLPAALRATCNQLPNTAVVTSQQLLTSSKASSEQLPPTSKPCSKKLPAALRASFNQVSNSPVETSQQMPISSNASSEQLRTTSKLSSKKLPAALRASFNHVPYSPVETFQKLPPSSNVSSQQPSESNKNSQNAEENFKQNMPRSGNIVTITAISKTNLVFIRSTTYEGNLSYLNTVDTLQSLGKMLQPLETLPKSGEVVIAKFHEQFNRALVLRAFDSTKILINLMDYGNMEQATMEDLFEAPKEFIYKPRHAIPVLLKDVGDFYMTQEIRKFMYTYLNNINVEIRYKTEDFQQDVYAVELIDENTQQNLNKMIIKLSKPVEPQNINEICDHNYLEKKILPVAKNMELVVMDNSLMCTGCISCTTKPYAIEIEKFKKDIQAYAESTPKEAYTPRADELCIAKYYEDDLWYRGRCLETVGDGHPSILFIDYGNITVVPIESIRRYPRQFTYPIYTVDCTIEGLPEFCDDDLVAKLEDLIPNGSLIKCENVTIDEDSNLHYLSLPNIIRELYNQ